MDKACTQDVLANRRQMYVQIDNTQIQIHKQEQTKPSHKWTRHVWMEIGDICRYKQTRPTYKGQGMYARRTCKQETYLGTNRQYLHTNGHDVYARRTCKQETFVGTNRQYLDTNGHDMYTITQGIGTCKWTIILKK